MNNIFVRKIFFVSSCGSSTKAVLNSRASSVADTMKDEGVPRGILPQLGAPLGQKPPRDGLFPL